MNRHDCEDKLIKLTQDFLIESNYQGRHINLSTSFQNHLGLGSLMRAELFRRIEKEFEVQLEDKILAEVDNLNEVINALLKANPRKIPAGIIREHKKEKTYINPIQAKTLTDVLALYATEDFNRKHVFFQDEQSNETIISYANLFENALKIAYAIQERGLSPGDTVAIMLPTHPDFLYTFFGVLLANCIPVPIYPPFRLHFLEAYAKQEATILQNAEVRLLVTFQEAKQLSKMLCSFVPSLKEVTTASVLLNHQHKAPLSKSKGSDFALIQYTSGSTSMPKGVLLTHQNLLANIRAFGEAIAVSENDVVVSWAPLYHDLGLIGFWLGCLYYGIPLVLMSPLTFINRPERWLWAMHYHRGTISGGPNFAYELCTRKIDPAQIEGLDLNSWRVAINGAEAIHPQTLDRFSQKFARNGFKREVFLPVYGLAESSVCVAVSPLNREPRIDRIERAQFENEGRAVKTYNASEQFSLEFVACGKPIPHHQVRVVDERNKLLPDRHVGKLQFKGPSSMQGYYRKDVMTQAIFHDGWLETGDLAYLDENEIFITGRQKEIIIKAGRNLSPHEIEKLAAEVPGIRKGCVIAFGVTDEKQGTEKIILVAETTLKKPSNAEQIKESIMTNMISTLDLALDQIILVPPQTIPKTSSGKLQRTACKKLFLSSKLSKSKLPWWLQFAKINLQSKLTQLGNSIKTMLRFIYTCYTVLLLLISLPLVYLSTLLFSKKIVERVCHYWTRTLFFLAFCPIDIINEAELKKQKGIIFVANHTSNLDSLLFLAILPPGTRLVVKKELTQIPVLKTLLTKLDYIAIDREAFDVVSQGTQRIEQALSEKSNLLIFPEGTFSYAAGLRPFKLGAFKIAAETKTPLLPIATQGVRKILRGDEFLLTPHSIRITVGEPIKPHGTDWPELMRLKKEALLQIANACGEPTLDFIGTGKAISDLKPEKNER